ncbi:PEP-CTERM/exosortase system-associated acyltransferase [Halomonas lysinitropha]|uniref:Autoinducer synthetase n=1 Tax=Halomonas lysinitropha TaxID=2607506 RepID=A0A5K1I0J7_9GAMM|nr:PEP-CTERM/exosortase system-associated acyltransferase [Halomonas lysinitropha]VVZ94975.1 Autoinducer synthetase [Halomonas lysinitropha]
MMPHSDRTMHSISASITEDIAKFAEPLDPTNAAFKDNLMKKFMREFEFKIASTQEEIEKALSLRHEVFIQELGYQMEERNHQLESDQYDDSSVHCILIHKSTGKTAGCFRIVTTQAPGSEELNKLPVEEHGSAGISHLTLHPSMLPRKHICEASRLAISKNFRLKSNVIDSKDSSLEQPESSDKSKETYPLILVSLFLAAYSLAELLGNRHLYAMMAPTLPRLLRKSGFDFIRLGDTINFHGRRNVFYINRSLAVSGMQNALSPIHNYIYQELGTQVAEYSKTGKIQCATS